MVADLQPWLYIPETHTVFVVRVTGAGLPDGLPGGDLFLAMAHDFPLL